MVVMRNLLKKRKGFTLVELLAVIVILAIIAVIAVPSILKIISGAREDSVKASARSAIKAIELEVTKDTTGTKTSGYLTALDIDNNPFKGGTWYYDKTLKKAIIYEARDSETITDSKYVITGDMEQINSDKFTVGKPKDTNPKLLANQINNGNPGYLTETQNNNYVCTNKKGDGDPGCTDPGEILWRIVRVFDDKSILMVTQDSIGTRKYQDHNNDNNFKVSPIRTENLNNFYEGLTPNQKNLIKYSKWDTRCSNDGTTKDECPGSTKDISIMDKVGLLTSYDYSVVSNNNSVPNNYLNNETYWWLGTGNSSGANYAWFVIDIGVASYYNVGIDGYGVRPAVVLNSGITVTGDGDGSSGSPYMIEE